MHILKIGVGAIATIAAILSGVWWVKAAYAEVAAQGNVGVGYGGVPVNVLNANGKVIDFIQSFQLQSRYNSRAALSAAVSAIAAAMLCSICLSWCASYQFDQYLPLMRRANRVRVLEAPITLGSVTYQPRSAR